MSGLDCIYLRLSLIMSRSSIHFTTLFQLVAPQISRFQYCKKKSLLKGGHNNRNSNLINWTQIECLKLRHTLYHWTASVDTLPLSDQVDLLEQTLGGLLVSDTLPLSYKGGLPSSKSWNQINMISTIYWNQIVVVHTDWKHFNSVWIIRCDHRV